MNNVYSLLHENVNRHHKKLFYDLDNSLALAIAKYNVDLNDRQARSVFKSLSNLTTSRYVATDTLCSNGIYALHREKPAPELKALRATLADDPRRVLISLHRRLAKNDVDLGDPKALAAFKAATELLGHFVQLEHDYKNVFGRGPVAPQTTTCSSAAANYRAFAAETRVSPRSRRHTLKRRPTDRRGAEGRHHLPSSFFSPALMRPPFLEPKR